MARGEYDEVYSFSCIVREIDENKVNVQYSNSDGPYNWTWIDNKGFKVGQHLEIVVYLDE